MTLASNSEENSQEENWNKKLKKKKFCHISEMVHGFQTVALNCQIILNLTIKLNGQYFLF